jgi:hypothetical protein
MFVHANKGNGPNSRIGIAGSAGGNYRETGRK